MVHSGISSEPASLRYALSSIKSDVYSVNAFRKPYVYQETVLQLDCPENVTAICDIDKCSADISNGLDVEVVKGTPASIYWKMEGATEATSPRTGINQIGSYVFNVGVTFVSYTASDNLGNSATCTFSVAVTDKQVPEISFPGNITIGCNDRVPSPHTTLQAFLNAGGKASDNCNLNTATFKLESEQKSNSNCPYTITRTYQIADRQGNIGQAKQFILVEKRTEPVLKEQEGGSLTLKSGMAIITSTALGGNWNDGTSWVGGAVPQPGDDVIIVNGATILMTGNQVCNDITINGTLNCAANTLQVNGSWVNNGVFNAGTGTVEFTGTSNATISGSAATVFKNFRISKGAVGNVLHINKDIQLGGTITFTSGLMQINSGVSVGCTFNTGFTIESSAGISLNGGTFTTGAFSLENEGLFQINSGTATLGGASGNSIIVRNSGTFDINGGTINVAGRLEISGGTADISGGTINLNTVGQNSSSTGSLDLSASSKFTMSAGTINFLNPNGTGNFDVIIRNSGGGIKSFPGGTFNFGDGTADTYKISSQVPFPNITSAANTNLEYRLIVSLTGTYNFPMVDNSGSAIPATVQLTGGFISAGAFIEVKTTGNKHPENKSSTNFLNRYWNVTTSGIGSPTYNFTAKYSNTDIAGNEAEIAMGAWSGSKPWTKYSDANAGANTVTATGAAGTGLIFAGITSDPPTVSITNDASVTICTGSSVNLTTTATGDPVITYSWSPATGLSAANIPNPVASPTTTTTYTVTVTDGNGFNASDDITVNVTPTNTIALTSGNSTQTVCINTAIAAITYSSTGATDATFSGLPAGVTGSYAGGNITISGTPTASGSFNYSIELTGGCGTITATGTINVTPDNTINLTSGNSSQTTCINTAISNITYSGTGASGATFAGLPTGVNGSYSGGNITISGIPTASGTFNYTVTLTGGCGNITATGTITVTPENTINLTSGNSTQTTCINAAIANITYSSTGAAGATFSGLPAGVSGNYSVGNITISGTPTTSGTFNYTVSLSGGCGAVTSTGTITVTPSITANATNTDPIKCFGGTANIQITASGGTPPYTFNLQGQPSNSTGIFTGITGSVGAGTTYTWSVTDALNCAAESGSITVTQPEELTATATATAITCNGLTSTVTITPTGGTAPYSYTFNGVTKTNGTYTGITAGTYNWSVKDANNCVVASAPSLTITQPTPITITSADVTTAIPCFGGTGTVTVVATGGTGTLSYTFNGQTNTTGVFSGVHAGDNLSISVKDANNCGPAFGTVTVNQPSAITATAAVTTAINCNGGTATVTITASGGTGALSYTFNGSTQASNVFTGVTPGNNIPWSVTDANGCVSVPGTINVTQPAALTASVSESTPINCFGGTANILITAAGGTGTKTYSFQGQPNNQTGIFNAIPGAVAPGTAYNWSVTDANGCATSGTYNVIQPAQIVISSIGSNSAICQGATLNLTSAATGGTGTLRYSWTGPNGYSVNNAQNPGIVNATPAASGTYTLTVTDANNCTATATTNVTVHATPTLAKPANQTVCHNASTTTVNFPGPNTYTWTNSDPSIGLAASGSGNIAAFTATNAGTTPVTATITVTPTGNSCPGTPQTFTITVNPRPNILVTNSANFLCNNGVTSISMSSDVAGTTFSWVASRVNGSTTGFSNGNGNTITHTLSGGGIVQYIITPSTPNPNGCSGDPVTVNVQVVSTSYDLRVITSGPNNTTFCPGNNFSIDFTGSPSGSGSGTTSTGWFSRTEWEWITRFTYTISNPNVVAVTSGGPINAGNLNFNVLNTTNVPQTAVVTITPWSYYRETDCRYRWFVGWECDPWPANYTQLCAGDPYEVTITVTPFAITCPTDIAANTDANQCYATITQPAPALTCGSGATISWTATGATPSSGTGGLNNVQFPKGETTVNYTATLSGNTRTCSFKVNVTDNQPPVISSCPPATTTLSMQSGLCGAPFSFNPTANDNCSPFTFDRTDGTGLNSGDIFPAGTTTISYLATDAAGNTATCSFDVTVNPDNEPPVITCVGNQAECAPVGSGYTMLGTAWDATVVENCPGVVTKTYALTGDTNGSGTSLNNVQFNVGTTTVTWTAKDINNNTSSCVFTVTVTQSPEVITSPVSQSVCLNGSVTLSAAATGTPAPTYQWRKDGVDIPGATNSTLTLTSIVAGDAGTYDVEVNNSCGAAISAPAIVTVTTPPVITQHPVSQSDCYRETVLFRTTVVGGSGNYTYYWESKRPTDGIFRDATRGNNWVTFPNDGEMLVPNLGNARSPDQTEYRVTVTDDCGNSVTSDIATVSVNRITNVDLVLQEICEGFGTSFTVTTSGSTPILYQWRKRNASGNWVNVNDGGAYSGATTATLTINGATPAESGEYSARAQFNITVPNNNNATTCWEVDYTLVGNLTVDAGPDVVATPDMQTVCPGQAITEIVLSNANGTPGTTYSWTRDNTTILTGIPASGNSATINGALASLDPTSMQTTTFTITATANGCVSTGQATITVGDDQAPTVAICPSDITVDAQAGVCGAVVNYSAPTFNDNCDGNGLVGTLISGPASGETFPIGTTTVTYEYTDAAGNTPATCSFDVIVSDKVDPTAICKNITVQLDPTGNVTITPADIDDGSSDNCGTPTLSIDISSFDCTDLGTNTVTLTATDGFGNIGTCTATVTVKDDDNPVAIAATVSQQDTLCVDDLTTVNIAATGGVGTLEYTFNAVTNTTGEFTVAAGYSYAWSVTNSLGCGTTSGNFFVVVHPDAATPVFTAGADVLCQDAANETYTATATNSNSISYSVLPAAAGTINSTTGEMDWNATFSGPATIRATATGFCNITTEDFAVDITPTVGTPSAITVAAGTEPTCQLINGTTTTTYASTATNNTGFNWSISNSSAGSIDPTSGVMTWADGFFGTTDIQVTASGCNGPSTQVVRTVNIAPTVGTPSVPTPSDATICQGSGTTTYTTSASDATSYTWTVSGTGNTISGTGTTGTVTWAPTFSGIATVEVTANGCNGPSAAASTTVTVLPTPTANISGANSVCQNTAEPDVVFTNPMDWPITVTYNIGVGASQTIDIAANSTASVSVPTSAVGSFNYNLISAEYQSSPDCANNISGSVTVIVRPEAPVTPGTISGTDYVLPASTETYTIVAVPNATTYTWTVPSGWTIVSGQGTTSITVTTGIANQDGNITVIASNDCGDSPASSLPVEVNPNLNIVLHPADQTDCFNNTVNFSVSISGGAPPIVYTWQRKRPADGSFTNIVGDPDITYPVAGSIQVANIGSVSNPDGTQYRVRITDTAGSDVTSNFATLTVDPLPVATAGGSQTICHDGSATVSGANAANGTVLWTHNGSGTLTGQTTLTPVYAAGSTDAGTTVTLTMTVTSSNSCSPQDKTATFTVNVLPEAQVNQPGNQEKCTGTPTDIITFSTSNTLGTTTYTWTNSEPTIGLAANGSGNIIAPFTTINPGTQPLVATIIVTPHITTGSVVCDGPSKTFTITVNPEPRATAPIGLTFCEGILSDPFPLTGTPTGVLFDISGGTSIGLADVNGVSEIPAFIPTSAGTASLTIIPKYNGCTGLPVSFNVTVRPTPVATMAGGGTVCQGAAPPSIIFTNPMNLPVVVSYNINSTTSQNVNIPARSNVSVAVPTNNAGTFTYNLDSVKYLDSNPPTCPNTSITGTAIINVVALPVPTITGPTNICAETTGNVYKTEHGMLNYTWVVSAGGTITAGGTPTDSTITVTWATGGSHNISVRYSNSSGCAASSPTIFPVNVYVLPIPTITGSTSACLNTSKIYSTQPGMTNYQWSFSAGALVTAGGGVNDNSVTVTWTDVGPQTISVNYTSVDGCDAPTETVKNITINPLPDPVITGLSTVCAGTSGHIYTTESGMSTYVWVVSSGGTITSGGTSNSATATIRWNADGPQTVSVSYINPATSCTPPSPTVYNVTVDPMPVPTITGPASVCVGSTGNTYTTEAGMTNYVWTVAAGGTITAGGGAGDASVTVTWTTTGPKTVRVNYQNSLGCAAATATTQNVAVNALPTPVIAGTNQTCLGSTITYSTVAGMSNYQWTVPAGQTIVSGGGTSDNSVRITWNTTGSQTISLNYTNTNGCSAAASTDYAVTIYDLPTPTITGPADACKGGAVTVYTTQPGMTAYIWSVSGGTITAGGSANDNTATVVWNTTGTQTISVNYYNANSCAAAAPFVYPVNILAPAPPNCPANRVVCSDDTPFNLTGSTPAGGVYAGPGVTLSGGNYTFNPATAGPGVHTITYTMPNICSDQCSFTITVNETPAGSATPITICSGYPTDLVLNSTVPGTTFTWTASVTSGSVTGFTNCSSGSCGSMITDTLTNNLTVNPGQNGANAVVRYVVTATKNGCSSTFNVDVTVRPQIVTLNLTWNSNFVEDFIEVCAGSEALSDNDIEILLPNGNQVNGGYFGTGANFWNPTFLYGPSPGGPWTNAPGNWHRTWEWLVDLSINNRLGYHYFVLQITDPVTGCVKYSNPAILNVVSALIVEAGDPEFICGGSTVPLTGAYVGGLSGGTIQGRWTVTGMNPAHGNNGTLSNTNFTTNPAGVNYTPPAGYIGTVTLTLTTNDPSGICVAITDTKTVTVVPPTSFTGCNELAGWPLTGTNSNGLKDDSEEPCLVTLVGSDNLSGSSGTTNITHCTGAGNVSFDWTFLAPPNKIVWHQEDQTVGARTSNTNLRVDRPTNVSAGDLIIITVHINDNNLNFNPGNGLTQILNTTHNSRTATVASFYKIATGSEPANYNIVVGGGGNLGTNDRIYASRVTGHNGTTPIGGSNGTTATFPYTNGENGYRNISITGFAAAANSMLVAALAVDINNGSVLEFSNAPVGMNTVYYDDNETSSRVANAIVSGNTGTRRFQWPSYNTRNRETMYAAAQMFVINPATNEKDEAFFTVNGVATFLGNTNGASGSRTVAVDTSDVFGFRVGTLTNTGGPGRLIIYNLTMPNNTPILSGADSVFVTDCQIESFIPTFEDPTVKDDCGTPVIKAGYPITDPVESDDCGRTQNRTWVYVDDCGEESDPFTQTAVWSVLAPITLECPVDPMLEACTDTAIVRTKYNEWVAGFTATGGCTMTTNLYAVPPLILANIACGDTLSFKFLVTDACGQKDSCTSTFTVKPITTLFAYCSADTVLASCTDTASIRAAYNAWKAGFYFDGGCADVTDNMIDFPALGDLSCGGQLEFTYFVSNSCGQNASCISTFAVEPPADLSVTVPDGVSLPLCSKTADIQAAYDAWKAGFSYTGGCNVVTNIDELPDLGDITCGGTLTFTYTAGNGNLACENLQQETSTFTVAEAPTLILSCPEDPNIAGCLGIQAITDAYDTWVDGFRASGGCNITTNIASIPPLGDLVCNGQLTFTFVVGNDSTLCTERDSCTSTFTIGAAPNLEVIVPADTVIQGCNTDQEIIDAFNDWKTRFTTTGGCNVSTSDLSIYDLPNSCGGTVTLIFSAWDNCSQIVTDSAKFTLNPDYISVNAPINEVADACQTQHQIDSLFADWKAKFGFSGGCGTVGTDLSVINAPDACGGTIVVNYTAQDVCGQVVNTSAIFTIDAPSDVLQEPSFTVPPATTVYRDDACTYDATPAITGIPTDMLDNCTLAANLTMAHSDSIGPGSCSSEIIIYRKWTVMDNCLNETSKMQIITVTDSIPPVVVCAEDVNGVADNGECDATNVVLGTSTATDNCALASFVGVRSDGLLITDAFPVGVTTITWTAIDACGNTSTCVQTVTLVDGITQPPVIDCPDDVVQNAGPNNCYLENVVIPDPTATDNCEVATISWVMSGATSGFSPLTGLNYVGGETFNVGVTEVIYTATDSAGNAASCSFTVTIKDVTPPVIDINTCLDVTDVAAPNNCSKIPGTLFDPDYSDTCWPKDSLELSWVLTGATTGTGTGTLTNQSFNVGVTFVEYTVTDPDGNHAECDFTVTIRDVTAPVIDLSTCNDVTENAAPDNCSKTPAAIMDPTYSDNCWPVDSLVLTYTITGATIASGSGSVTGLTFNVGVSEVTYTVADPDGNEASCTFTVTIVDVTPPVLDLTNCVDVTDVAEEGDCSKVSAKLIDPDYSDTCWPKDSLVLSWTMTGATTGSGIGSVKDSAFNVGVTTVTYTVTDPDGNFDDCSFTVTIKDVTPPSVGIEGCEDVTDVTDGANCTHVPGDIDDPVYSDTCWDIVDLTITWTMTGATIRNGIGSVKGEAFNAGVTTVKYYVSDPDGNMDSCDFTVTIIPFNPPQFTAGCPPDIIAAPNDPGLCEADLTIPDPTVDDPCNIGYTIINDRTGTDNASGVYPVGVTQVRWIITPTVGIPDTCYQTITVTDEENPIITNCPETLDFDACSTDVITEPAFSAVVANSSYTEFSNATNNGAATDNCVIDSVTYIDVISGGICPIVITRTWTVFDAAGNSATCDQVININDITAPVVDCPENDTIPSDFNLPYSDYTLPPFGFSDNCTDSVDITVTWTISGVTNDSGSGLIPSPYRFNRGLNIISYTFADACGNETTCEFTLFVLYPPDIDCLPPLTYNTDADACTHRLPTGPNDPGVPDNITGDLLTWEYTIYNPDGSVAATGGSTGVTADPIDPYDFMLGTSTIRWVGINASGTDTCSQLITVVDNQPPTFDSAPITNCVEMLNSATYTTGTPNPNIYTEDNLILDPSPDVFVFEAGNTTLDLSNFADNCCDIDSLIIHWRIDFVDTYDPMNFRTTPTLISHPSITGTGQPSEYGSDIHFPGDGVTFEIVTHTINYWVEDCNGNISDEQQEDIIVTPRPELIKLTH